MKKRVLKWNLEEEQMRIIEKRYPDESTRALADDLGLPFEAVKGYAQRVGLRKTKQFKHNMGIKYGKLQQTSEESKIPPEMRDADKRQIHSGLLLTKGNRRIHIPNR